MRVAIVVDWLTDCGGAESVFSEAMKALPGATLHALIDNMSDADHRRLALPRAHVSWLQGIPGIERSYRNWLPMMPAALKSLDLSGADVVLAISHAVAKAAPVAPNQSLLCLCLSPMRYAWDLRQQYLEEAGLADGMKGILARAMLGRMRNWDLETSARVDSYASISNYIAGRVKRAYNRDSTIIYPPVDTEYFTPEGARGDYYVTASRFVPYKRVDLIVRAFTGDPARKLVVIGDGPDNAKIRAGAGPNVSFVGHADRDELRHRMRGARAFVFAADEDFGIAPVEAQACGVPVIAYGKGGALETIVGDGPSPTGLFFAEQTEEAIRGAVAKFETMTFSPAACRANAERFSAVRFRSALIEWVGAAK